MPSSLAIQFEHLTGGFSHYKIRIGSTAHFNHGFDINIPQRATNARMLGRLIFVTRPVTIRVDLAKRAII
jgi:hypothetical protein